MASPAPSERRFEELSHAVHERMPFSTVKISHSLTTLFQESVYHQWDQLRVLAEFEANGEEYPNTSDTSDEIVYDTGHKNVEVHLALSGVRSHNNSVWRPLMGMVELVSIADSVEELCENCFCECRSLSRVTFGESSSLKLIGQGAFCVTGVREIHIPDAVEELCEKCFSWCESLSRVTFGESSSLKLIGKGAFRESGVVEIHLPDSVEELCEECFCRCEMLCRVTFGESSLLKLIGKRSLCVNCVCKIHIPNYAELVPCDVVPHYTRVAKL